MQWERSPHRNTYCPDSKKAITDLRTSNCSKVQNESLAVSLHLNAENVRPNIVGKIYWFLPIENQVAKRSGSIFLISWNGRVSSCFRTLGQEIKQKVYVAQVYCGLCLLGSKNDQPFIYGQLFLLFTHFIFCKYLKDLFHVFLDNFRNRIRLCITILYKIQDPPNIAHIMDWTCNTTIWQWAVLQKLGINFLKENWPPIFTPLKSQREFL